MTSYLIVALISAIAGSLGTYYAVPEVVKVTKHIERMSSAKAKALGELFLNVAAELEKAGK